MLVQVAIFVLRLIVTHTVIMEPIVLNEVVSGRNAH